MPPTKFRLNPTPVRKQMSFEDFQDGRHGHLGYRNETILVLLNLHVAPMPPIKCQLKLAYGLRGYVD